MTTQPTTRPTHPTKMRRYHVVSGILLVLPIINFAVAAPALLPEKRQAGVDVAHIPEDAVTMLGKRVGTEEFDKLFLQKLNKLSFLDDELPEPEALAAKPKPDPKPSNQGPSNPGSSNPGPSNPESSNPGPSNLESSNQGPSNPGPSNPGPSFQGPSNEGRPIEPDAKKPKVRWIIGHQARS